MNLRNFFLVVLDDRMLRFRYNMGVLWWGSSTDSKTAYSWFIITGHKEKDQMPWLLFYECINPLRISHLWSNVSSTLSPNVITLGLQVEGKHFGMAHKPFFSGNNFCLWTIGGGCISPDLVSALLSVLHVFSLCPHPEHIPLFSGLNPKIEKHINAPIIWCYYKKGKNNLFCSY